MKRLILTILAALMLWPSAVSAHDVPEIVRIAAFVKPERDRLTILVRMPANAFIDFLFPMFQGNELDLTAADAVAAEGARVWIADLMSFAENGAAIGKPQVVKTRISRLNDPFFSSFDAAFSYVNGPHLPADAIVTLDQAAVDALLEVPITSDTASFSIEPRFARLGVIVKTTMTFLPPQGGLRQFQYEGDPGAFELDPSAGSAFRRFLNAGVAHYVSEREYLLFVLCVALMFRRVREVVPFAVALAAAESVALVASLELMPISAWVPVLSAVLVAAATAYMGIEAVISTESSGDGSTGNARNRRLGLAIAAGLIFGFGFWASLEPMLQFGGAHALAAGSAFAAGVALSELVALAVVVVAVQMLLTLTAAPRVVVMIAAAVVIHVSWRRLLDRADALTLAAPNLSPSTVLVFALVTMLTVVLVAAAASFSRISRSVRL